MSNIAKIVKFADVYYEGIDSVISNLWDGKPPSISDTRKPSGAVKSQPIYTETDSIPGYKRIRQDVSKELQDISFNILKGNINSPIGTFIPFNHNGIQYGARIESHPPNASINKYHPGVSLFISTIKQRNNSLSNNSLNHISKLIPEFQQQVAALLQKGIAEGLRPEIVDSIRSQEIQDKLYEQGRTKPGRVVTWTRHSKHTRGMAVDIAQIDENGQINYQNIPEGFWNRMGAIGRSLGMRWGGDWKGKRDKAHFEYNIPEQVS